MCELRVRNRDPVSGFHTLTVLSQDPEANKPVLLKATDITPDVCEVRVCKRDPVSGFHTLTDLSPDPEANKPVLLKATE